MHDIMRENWNGIVGPNDIVYYEGDFAFGTIKWCRELLNSLNGYKILIRGNHDGTTTRCSKVGWDEIYDELVLEDFFLRHIPEYDATKWHGCTTMLNGHVHEKWKMQECPLQPWQEAMGFDNRSRIMINVGVDQWNFTPIPYDTIRDLINEK